VAERLEVDPDLTGMIIGNLHVVDMASGDVTG
jgi:hypothetical protein